MESILPLPLCSHWNRYGGGQEVRFVYTAGVDMGCFAE